MSTRKRTAPDNPGADAAVGASPSGKSSRSGTKRSRTSSPRTGKEKIAPPTLYELWTLEGTDLTLEELREFSLGL